MVDAFALRTGKLGLRESTLTFRECKFVLWECNSLAARCKKVPAEHKVGLGDTKKVERQSFASSMGA